MTEKEAKSAKRRMCRFRQENPRMATKSMLRWNTGFSQWILQLRIEYSSPLSLARIIEYIDVSS